MHWAFAYVLEETREIMLFFFFNVLLNICFSKIICPVTLKYSNLYSEGQ